MPKQVFIGLIFAAFGSAGAIAQAKPAAPPTATPRPSAVTPVPVPRTAYLETMDGEFKRMDADKNGILTKVEIQAFQRATAMQQARARHDAIFNELDSDRNGQLSKAEFARAQNPAPPANPSPLLGQADLNRDQTVTLVEYRTAKLGIFDRMDVDKDGVVSVAELRAAGIIQ